MKSFFKISALCVLLFPALAAARTGDHKAGSWADWQEIGVLTNCSAASINSAVTCGDTFGIKTEGYNAITFEILYTRDAGSGYQFYLQACNEGHTTSDCTDATDWYTVAVEEVIPSTGVELTTDLIYHDTTSSDQLVWSIPINYRRMRLASFEGKGSPSADDKITVNVRLNWVPAL